MNGRDEKTPLFALGKNGYIQYLNTLKTLGKDDIFKNIEYSHKSTKGETVYSERTLNITTGLKSKENFNVRYELYDPEGNLEKWGGTVLNKDITNKNNAIFTADITGNDFVFGGDYHRLVITAVTTDDEPKELELYNDTLKATTLFGELKEPNIVLYQSTGIDKISGNYDYYIDYNINIEDTDRVIKDGKFYVELKYSPQEKVCPNEEDCKLEIDLYNLKCNSNGANSKIASCTIIENKVNNTFTLKVRYASLKPNTENIRKPHLTISFTNSNNGCSLLSASKILKVSFQTANKNKSAKARIKKALNILVNGELSTFLSISIKFKLLILCATSYKTSIVLKTILIIPIPNPLKISKTLYFISLAILNVFSIQILTLKYQ